MKKIVTWSLAVLLVLSSFAMVSAAAYTDQETVKQVQQALNDAGYSCGSVDGVAGSMTAEAVSRYQTDHGLEATGVIDDALLGAMGLAGDAAADTAETVSSGNEPQDAGNEDITGQEPQGAGIEDISGSGQQEIETEAVPDMTEEELETCYSEAEDMLAAGENARAAMLFGACGMRKYRDARERSDALWDQIADRKTICTGKYHIAGIKTDGTVAATPPVWTADYSYSGECDVSDWTDIEAVCAGSHHTVGLRTDGTVAAVGANENGQCDVGGWRNIVAVAAGDSHTIGLRADGTIVAAGLNKNGQCDVSEWTDIVAIAAGDSHTVGLKADGTVIAAGSDEYSQCEVGEWTNVVEIAAGGYRTAGLLSNGMAVAAGLTDWLDDISPDVAEWRDMTAVAAGSCHIVGLKTGGTTADAGGEYDFSGNKYSLWGWSDITEIAAGGNNTVGLKSDGTVIAVEEEDSVSEAVLGWQEIRQPADRIPISEAVSSAEKIPLPWPSEEVIWQSSLTGDLLLGFIVSQPADTGMHIKIYRADYNRLEAQLFIGGGGFGSVYLTAGNYMIKYGTGKTWYGPDESFGEEGTYEIMTFGSNGSQTAALQRGGNYTISINMKSAAPDASGVGSIATTHDAF